MCTRTKVAAAVVERPAAEIIAGVYIVQCKCALSFSFHCRDYRRTL